MGATWPRLLLLHVVCLLLLLLIHVPAVLLLLLGMRSAAAVVVVPVGQVVVVVVVLLSWWQLMGYVKPRGHPHEAQRCNKPCCNFLEHWAHPIAHHWSDCQHEWCYQELRVVTNPGQQQQGQAEGQQHDDLHEIAHGGNAHAQAAC